MKKIGLIGVLAIVAVVVIAVVMAGQMGETAEAYARGKIILDDNVKDAAKSASTLFIIATGPDRPMPLGAFKKTMSGTGLQGEIYDFVLTKDNMQLMPGAMNGDLPPQFKLKARLDLDGSAGPDQPGDVVGEIAMVDKGADGLELHLNRVVQ